MIIGMEENGREGEKLDDKMIRWRDDKKSSRHPFILLSSHQIPQPAYAKATDKAEGGDGVIHAWIVEYHFFDVVSEHFLASRLHF